MKYLFNNNKEKQFQNDILSSVEGGIVFNYPDTQILSNRSYIYVDRTLCRVHFSHEFVHAGD